MTHCASVYTKYIVRCLISKAALNLPVGNNWPWNVSHIDSMYCQLKRNPNISVFLFTSCCASVNTKASCVRTDGAEHSQTNDQLWGLRGVAVPHTTFWWSCGSQELCFWTEWISKLVWQFWKCMRVFSLEKYRRSEKQKEVSICSTFHLITLEKAIQMLKKSNVILCIR